jgi:hypothetical protein
MALGFLTSIYLQYCFTCKGRIPGREGSLFAISYCNAAQNDEGIRGKAF